VKRREAVSFHAEHALKSRDLELTTSTATGGALRGVNLNCTVSLEDRMNLSALLKYFKHK